MAYHKYKAKHNIWSKASQGLWGGRAGRLGCLGRRCRAWEGRHRGISVRAFHKHMAKRNSWLMATVTSLGMAALGDLCFWGGYGALAGRDEIVG